MSDAVNLASKELKIGNKKTFERMFKTYYRALCIYAERMIAVQSDLYGCRSYSVIGCPL